MNFSELPLENKAKSIIEAFNAVVEYGKKHHLFDNCLDSPDKQDTFELDEDSEQICFGDISIGCTTEGDPQFESFWIKNPDYLYEAFEELSQWFNIRYEDFDQNEYVSDWLEAKGNGCTGVPDADGLVNSAEEIESNFEEYSKVFLRVARDKEYSAILDKYEQKAVEEYLGEQTKEKQQEVTPKKKSNTR